MKIIEGKRIGRLLIIKELTPKLDYKKRWVCQCDCGNNATVRDDQLKSGHTTSCGCYRREQVGNSSRTHGQSLTKTYKSWLAMRNRCLSPNNPAYKNYGGRGITVCRRWLKFENFFSDMGDAPADKSLDRINNNKGYTKGNCRWATQKQQMNNIRTNVLVEVRGKIMTLSDCCAKFGIKRVGSLKHHINEHYKAGQT